MSKGKKYQSTESPKPVPQEVLRQEVEEEPVVSIRLQRAGAAELKRNATGDDSDGIILEFNEGGVAMSGEAHGDAAFGCNHK